MILGIVDYHVKTCVLCEGSVVMVMVVVYAVILSGAMFVILLARTGSYNILSLSLK